MISKEFLTAGKAIFTVTLANDEHMTYRVNQPKPDLYGAKKGQPKPFFIGKLTGPDNTNSYSYLGILDPETLEVKITRNSKYTDTSEAVKVLKLALESIRLGVHETKIKDILHCGYCGRCGRLLTVPESIQTGIGPECAGRMGFGFSQELGIDWNSLVNEVNDSKRKVK